MTAVDRREFFRLAAVLAVPGVAPDTRTDELPPREFHRYSYATDSWTRIDCFDVGAGDVIRVFDPPDGHDDVVLVDSVDHENRQFFSSYRVDKETNRWVILSKG